jgi:hypothetical protein
MTVKEDPLQRNLLRRTSRFAGWTIRVSRQCHRDERQPSFEVLRHPRDSKVTEYGGAALEAFPVPARPQTDDLGDAT